MGILLEPISKTLHSICRNSAVSHRVQGNDAQAGEQNRSVEYAAARLIVVDGKHYLIIRTIKQNGLT